MISRVRTLALFVLILSGALYAQTPEEEQSKAARETEKLIDLSTPGRSSQYFLDLYRAERFAEAARLLNLNYLGAHRRRTEGPGLARRLGFVLAQRNLFDPAELDATEDDTDGAAAKTIPATKNQIVVARLQLGEGDAALVMKRSTVRGRIIWRFTPASVRLIPALYKEYGPGRVAELLPAEYAQKSFLGLELWQWAGLPAALLLTLIFSLIFLGIAERIIGHFVKRTPSKWDDELFEIVRLPMRTLSSLVVLLILIRLLRLPGDYGSIILIGLKIALVGAGVWLLLRPANFLFNTLQEQLTRGTEDIAHIRGVRTQLIVIRRVVYFLVVLIGLALALTQFKEVRAVGVSLLASAGVAGVMLSLAAQKSLSSLLAGIQLALTKPLRIGDKVLLNGEVGWVEEINLTFLVMRVWDLRRLVVPIAQVLDEPFENWSLSGGEQMGDVTFQADYALPVDLLRAETKRLLENSENWNRNVWSLQVTDSSDRTITLRALMTAHPDKLWDLRCEIREGLIEFLRQMDGGKYLPRMRIEQ